MMMMMMMKLGDKNLKLDITKIIFQDAKGNINTDIMRKQMDF